MGGWVGRAILLNSNSRPGGTREGGRTCGETVFRHNSDALAGLERRWDCHFDVVLDHFELLGR